MAVRLLSVEPETPRLPTDAGIPGFNSGNNVFTVQKHMFKVPPASLSIRPPGRIASPGQVPSLYETSSLKQKSGLGLFYSPASDGLCGVSIKEGRRYLVSGPPPTMRT